MDYLQNHIWCSDSNWGGGYDCRHLISLSMYKDHNLDDWYNIVDRNADYYEVEANIAFRNLTGMSMEPKTVINFKPEVLQWLDNNVKDRVDPECIKGWCVGSIAYRASTNFSMAVFFHRRNDALAFVKKFSKWGKPVHYCQYFSDVRKKLNLETLKYEEI